MKKKRMAFTGIALMLLLAMLLAGTSPAATNGWYQKGTEWHYAQSGKDLTGWQTISGSKYYLNSKGVMLTGWQKISNKWYFFASSGKMKTGWLSDGGKWYYLNSSGVMQTGWVKDSGKWYYLNASGVMLTGWQKISNKWYYLGTNGVMVTGWQKINNKWYYFLGGDKGSMVTGWKAIDGKWYYFFPGDNGAMATGWQKINNKWYYFASNGAMQTGWQTIGGKTYYFDEEGIMQTEGLYYKGDWYYLGKDGVMQTGWVKVDGYEYYFDKKTGKLTDFGADPYGDYPSGYAGTLSIPSLGINVSLYYSAGGADAQAIADAYNSAVYIWNAGVGVIGDHRDQAFASLSSVTKGTKATISRPDGTKETYVCIGGGLGRNTGSELFDQYGNSWLHFEYLSMYTCYADWTTVYVCQWAKQ